MAPRVDLLHDSVSDRESIQQCNTLDINGESTCMTEYNAMRELLSMHELPYHTLVVCAA